jgi:hypothetical protein
MKRLLLALTILAAGAAVFCVFRSSAARLRNESSERRDAWQAQTQLLDRARVRHAELTTRIRELKQTLLVQPQSGGADSELANMIATNGTNHLTPEARERLLAELGFDWNSARDYVVMSKDSLPGLNLESIRGNRLTEVVCGVLAVTSEERAGIDSLLEGAAAEFKAWAMSHVQRTEPEGDILAKYTLPFDGQFSQTLSNTFAQGVIAALGAERGKLMLAYASSWTSDLGMRGSGPTILTIKRPAAGQEDLPYELRRPNGGTMYASVSSYQPMPEAFRPIFPGGWSDLATREGFELPQGFRTK